MQKLYFLESHFPDKSLESGLARVNQLEWNISVEKQESEWIVFAGYEPLFSSDNREAIDAFLYGLSVAYAVLPDEIFAGLKKQVNAM